MTEEAVAEARYRVEIERIATGGEGVGRVPDGRVVFVPRTAPGDVGSVRLTGVKPRWARGEMEALEVEGPDRRNAPCPHFPECGGCALQHIRYSAQLEAKGAVVIETLARIGGQLALPVPTLHAAPSEFGYRNRMTFHLRRLPRERVVAGLHHRRRPGRLVAVGNDCLLPEEPIAAVWRRLQEAWGPGARLLPGGPMLRLTLQAVREGGVTLLIEEGRGRGSAAALVEEVEGLEAVWLRGEGEASPRLAAGAPDVMEAWAREAVPLRPGAFIQVNREAAGILHDLVVREVGPPRGLRIVDAYCGFGAYGRGLARQGARVTGIEMEAAAVSMDRAGPVAGFTLLHGRVEDRLEEALPADAVILNPPRAGVASAVLHALIHSAPGRLIYVSCDPATLARDLGTLGEAFRVERLQVVDLFPQTAHVETVVTLVHTGKVDP